MSGIRFSVYQGTVGYFLGILYIATYGEGGGGSLYLPLLIRLTEINQEKNC